jgi:tetratricopeptide (TPR) repeat protein
MSARKIKQLERQALEAHQAKRYAEETQTWRKLHELLPNDDQVLSNLASAEMLAGNLAEALKLFDRVLRRSPQLARALNNRAGLRLRLGADLHELFPDFLRAVELAASTEEFAWHSINLCQSAAFGSDNGAPELFDTLDERLMSLIDRRFPEALCDGQKAFFRKFIGAYREIAQYRKAIAERHWSKAEAYLRNAQTSFRDAGLDNFARGGNAILEDLLLCKQVFGLLESIAADQLLGPEGARVQASQIQRAIETTRLTELASMQRRLFQVLNAFLVLFTKQLAYLAAPTGEYQPSDASAETLMWLTGSSFRRIGDDLLGITSFVERRCRELSNIAGQLASSSGVRRVAFDEWSKLALYVHSRVLDLRDVDAGLARAALGWTEDPLGRVRADLHEFRAFVERQAHADLFVGEKPQENIARALLQASLSGRSYREVPVRGGRSDVLFFERDGQRLLIETKIWRGPDYHEQGKRELSEYIEGENDDGKLLGAFYVVFDATDSARAVEHEGSPVTTTRIGNTTLETVIVRVRPPQPSQKPSAGRPGDGLVPS